MCVNPSCLNICDVSKRGLELVILCVLVVSQEAVPVNSAKKNAYMKYMSAWIQLIIIIICMIKHNRAWLLI